MQKAMPYMSSWTQIYPNSVFNRRNNDQMQITQVSSSSSSSCQRSHMVMENAVVMMARRGCCMGHVAKRLLLTHGVNPLVNEVGDDEDEAIVLSELGKVVISGDQKEEKIENLPLVFIGGKLFGGLDKLMAAHISGDLVPLLKQAGALWL